ncbi:MAG: uncharacterized protein JWP46_3569 [Modestobacter sp.]|nr:uncharacterized protein [Modestobacter sp.]
MQGDRTTLWLLDWRRRVGGLYAGARAADDPEEGWRAWRAGRDALVGSHPDPPLDDAARAVFTGIPVAAYDPALRFLVRLDTDVEPLRLQLPTADDGVVTMDRLGRVTLGDLGRRLVVDLNFAYHPSCTYDPRWSCPPAPEGNRIDAVVTAGEQLPPGGRHPPDESRSHSSGGAAGQI